jgi:hypothetical protein
MQTRRLVLISSLLCVGFLSTALSQEGHPLVGTWHGSWGTSSTDRNDVTVVLEWDGKTISGLVNPGPDSYKLTKTVLTPSSDPDGWAVHFEADTKDRNGKPVHYVIDGKIEYLTKIQRSIVGTWSHDNVKANFKLTRDY